jgi:SAM-dependent methyltransferase
LLGLNSERQERLYTSGVYLEHSPNWSEHEAPDKVKTAMALFKRASLENLTSILDVGCGSGGVLDGIVAAMPSVKTAIGIDTAPDAIRIGKKMRGEGSNVDLRVADVGDISDRFDLVIASHVVEHVSDYGDFLEGLSQRSNFIYINIPIEINVFYALRPAAHRNLFRKYGHVNFYTESFFDDFVKSRGFEIVAKGYGTELMQFERRSVPEFFLYAARKILGCISPSIAMRLLGGFTYQIIVKRDAKTV